MPKHRIFTTAFCKVYPLYVQKAERKNRTKDEVDQIIRWLTGYSQAGLEKQIKQQSDFENFFSKAPAIHPNTSLIKRGCVWCPRGRSRESTNAKNPLSRQAD